MLLTVVLTKLADIGHKNRKKRELDFTTMLVLLVVGSTEQQQQNNMDGCFWLSYLPVSWSVFGILPALVDTTKVIEKKWTSHFSHSTVTARLE